MSTLNSSQLIDTFNWRYATKVFDASKKITSEDWNTLEESLRLTPSSFGLQPWHFLVITNDDLRTQLLPHSWGQKQVTDCSHFVVLCHRTDIETPLIDEFIADLAQDRGVEVDTLKGYRDVIVDFVTAMTPSERQDWAKRQSYLALQRLMDAAALLDIDTCPMEGFVAAEYDQVLELSSKNLAPAVCCAVGYRSSEDKYAELAKSRFSTDKVFTHLS